MQIEGLDHFVLTVADVGRTRGFYERVLGMEPVVFGEGRLFGAVRCKQDSGRESTHLRPSSCSPFIVALG